MPLEYTAFEDKPLSAKDLINNGLAIMSQRAQEYGKGSQGERSFERISTAFNAITGHSVKPSEIALMLQILKDVRQWTNPDEFHLDSAVDAINYSALKSELVAKETSKE